MLENYLNPRLVFPDINGCTKTDVIIELAGGIVSQIDGLKQEVVASALTERESLGATAIENGFAIPHAKIDGIKNIVISVARSKTGVDFGAEDGALTNIFFTMLAPAGSAGEHLKALARLTKILSIKGIKERLLAAENADEMYKILVEADEKFMS